VQAHDIIRTRLFYTTIHAHYAHDSKPFETVMMSGHVLAAKGEKISKSKGNAKVEPDELLEKWGADPVRYWALSGQLGKDIIFDENMIKNGNKLVMKLRNVANFLQMTGCVNTVSQTSVSALYPTDQWILSRLQETIAVMRKQLDSYEIGLAKIAFEDFFRSDVCDMYLEMVKTRLYKPDQFTDGLAKQQSAQQTLYVVFFNIIKLIAPYLPHITEEIYQ
jgi:valyl-tRNA synthetase